MKDVVNGVNIQKTVGLYLQIYSFKLEDDKGIKKVKDVKYNVVKRNTISI